MKPINLELSTVYFYSMQRIYLSLDKEHTSVIISEILTLFIFTYFLGLLYFSQSLKADEIWAKSNRAVIFETCIANRKGAHIIAYALCVTAKCAWIWLCFPMAPLMTAPPSPLPKRSNFHIGPKIRFSYTLRKWECPEKIPLHFAPTIFFWKNWTLSRLVADMTHMTYSIKIGQL